MNRAQLKNLLWKISDSKRSAVFYGFPITLAAAVTALACGWSYVTDHSVRFNSFRTGRGFYRLPPLPIMFDSKTNKEIPVVDQQSLYMYEEQRNENSDSSTPPELTASDIWQNAQSAVKSENMPEAEQFLRKFIEITALPTIDEEDAQSQRNSAHDMLDALTALQQGSATKAVKEYLEARLAYPKWPTIEHSELPFPTDSADRNLQDNWSYLKAATLYTNNSRKEALDVFLEHARVYPRSEKNEAVLYMIAKLQMESSYGFENQNCGIDGNDQRGEPIENSMIEPTEKCRDEQWQKALMAFKNLIKRYPNGRYSNDARGWLAFLYKRGGERANALSVYYSLLGHPTDLNVRLQAKKSLQIIGHEYDDATLDEVEKLIADDANTALAYAYHRIYNHAVDLTYDEFDQWCCYDENTEWQTKAEEKKRVADVHDNGNHELRRVARFATRMMNRHPRARVAGAFVVRVAQAQLELQYYPDAMKLAQKALAMGVAGEMRAEALWIKGSSEHRQKSLKGAQATFGQLIAEFPKGRLTEGARRLLALTAEDQDDLETALEQYLALDYKYDAAYFIDVLLPTDRLARFVAGRKESPRYNYLLYSLGVRYLRDKRWDDARAVLRQIRTETGPREYSSYGETEPAFSKEPDWNWDDQQKIKTSWVMQDLKTIDTLEYLEKAIEAAPDDEAKAEAMYQLASYQFDANPLLFYNPAAWQGIRSELLAQLDVSNSMRVANESQLIFEYSQSHETLARSIPIYQDIGGRYPQTKAAKDAIFSEAVAHERLADLNSYWREIYGRGLFAGTKLVRFTDITRLYPRFRWPLSRQGWEASTRTVNGGPGWAPKPTPLPKLTRTQNFERKFKRYFGAVEGWVTPKLAAVTGGYAAYVRGWLEAVLTAIGVLLGMYFALLGLHFRKPLSAVIIRRLYPEDPTELLPDSDSRLEKVIEGTD